MLRKFGSALCPRCGISLVHQYDFAGDWILPGEDEVEDQRWICPDCGLSRPVIYSVDRRASSRPAGLLGRAFNGVLPRRLNGRQHAFD